MKELNEEFKVENKAIPAGDYGAGRRSRYPFGSMKVGQSFFIPEGFEGIAGARSAAAQYSKRHDMKFVIVRDGEGYRCGRVK